MNVWNVLSLMMERIEGHAWPRALIETKEGADWADKPAPPPPVSTWAEDFDGYHAYLVHERKWPPISRKLFRRLVRCGLIELSNGRYLPTRKGEEFLDQDGPDLFRPLRSGSGWVRSKYRAVFQRRAEAARGWWKIRRNPPQPAPEPVPEPPRKEWRRKGWLERLRKRRQARRLNHES
jgi:hypothetical protein